ncbi:hypothetical protein Fot_22508 [Forsythia ovata]|uniref:Uncharacterized protein n=1 Tax=Forsythia ovata TaxID=205694 RepID=A0ABD1UXX6_9LAMI
MKQELGYFEAAILRQRRMVTVGCTTRRNRCADKGLSSFELSKEHQLHLLIREAPELFQYYTIRPSLAHENRIDNVVKVSIGDRDHFDLFFFNPHMSLATVKV